MKEVKTIQATANHGNRTFTIRTFYNGKLSSKYRTIRMDREEFDSCLYNTENDWSHFLSKSQDYSEVK